MATSRCGPVRSASSAFLAGFSCTMSILPLPVPAVEAHHGVMHRARILTGPETLLLVPRARPLGLTLVRIGWWARVLAGVLASALDRRLADGCAPESGLLVAVRASRLVSPSERRRLAETWESLIGIA